MDRIDRHLDSSSPITVRWFKRTVRHVHGDGDCTSPGTWAEIVSPARRRRRRR